MSEYYTPKLEEFNVGFEYEVNVDVEEIEGKGWMKCVYPKDPFIGESISRRSSLENFRVKYLDQSDIESFGFELRGTTIDKWYKLNKECVRKLSNFTTRSIQLRHDFRDNQGVVIDGFEYEDCKGDYDMLYRGSCKNKSELKQVLKMIGVIEDE